MPVSSHEDIPRITVESIADWRRIEASYTQVAIQQLDEQLVANGLTHERDEHLKLLHSVCVVTHRVCSSHLPVVFAQDLRQCQNERSRERSQSRGCRCKSRR
jgi:hypothetical protein